MKCRVCDAVELALVLDLGDQPWCNHFIPPHLAGTEPRYPLRLVHCARCGTAQLDFTVKKEILFGDHTYLSGITLTLREHFRKTALEVAGRFLSDKKRAKVLDIGSNDGSQLEYYRQLGYQVLGIESSKTTARIANERGIPTINTFFNRETAHSLGQKFDVINASGVFFHLEELHSVTEGIRDCLKPRGVFVVQFLYMKKIVENVAFDQIYHEHLLYYNIATLSTLLQLHGLEIFDAYLSPIHGGSVIAFAGHKGVCSPSRRLTDLIDQEIATKANHYETYRQFARRVAQKRAENLAFLRQAQQAGKRIFGLGAPAKGNTLLNYFQIGPSIIECLVERNELRRGLVSPGMHIPVVLESEVSIQPDIYYVLAWNFRREILHRYRKLLESGTHFYFPIVVDS